MSAGPENPYRATGADFSESPETGGVQVHVLAWLGVVLGLAPLGVALLLAPHFQGMFQSFGADLPLVTRWVVEWPIALAAPSGLMAVWRVLRPRGLRQAWTLFGIGLALAVLLSIATVFLFYLPIFQLAQSA